MIGLLSVKGLGGRDRNRKQLKLLKDFRVCGQEWVRRIFRIMAINHTTKSLSGRQRFCALVYASDCARTIISYRIPWVKAGFCSLAKLAYVLCGPG